MLLASCTWLLCCMVYCPINFCHCLQEQRQAAKRQADEQAANMAAEKAAVEKVTLLCCISLLLTDMLNAALCKRLQQLHNSKSVIKHMNQVHDAAAFCALLLYW